MIRLSLRWASISKRQSKPVVQKEHTAEDLDKWDMGISDNEVTTGGESSDEDDEPDAKRRKTGGNYDAIIARYAAVGMEYGKPATKMPTEGIVFKPEDFKIKPAVQYESKAGAQGWSNMASSSSGSKTTKGKDRLKPGKEDPLAEFYAEAKAQTEHKGRAGVRS